MSAVIAERDLPIGQFSQPRPELVESPLKEPTVELIGGEVGVSRRRQRLGSALAAPMQDSLGQYIEEIDKREILPESEQYRLARLVRGEDEKQKVLARQKMAEGNLGLVIAFAKRYQGRGILEFRDLVQEGNVGLMRAIDKFDPTLGYRFSTCAAWWINRAIQYALEKQRENNGISVESLDEIVGEDGETTLGELIPDDQALDPETEAVEGSRRGALLELIANGIEDQRDWTVLSMRYGLSKEGQRHTLAETGRAIGTTGQGARRRELKILAELKSLAEAQGL